MSRRKRFLQNAATLCATSLAMRLMSIRFGAWMISRIGPAGMGLYQLTASVYMMAVTLACSGIHMAATRLTAEEAARENSGGIRRVMGHCLVYASVFGCIAWAILYRSADFLGSEWLGDSRTVPTLRILACSLPCISLSSAMRGYFTAMGRISRCSAADITEQLLQMILTPWVFLHSPAPDVESACTAMALGNTMAEAAGCILLGLLFLTDIRRHPRHKEAAPSPMLRRLLHISLPVAGSAWLRSGLSSVNQLLIPTSLIRSGMDGESALAGYGAVHSMVMPLLQFPDIFLGAAATLLVPEFTDMRTRQYENTIRRTLSRAIRAALLFGIGAAGFFTCFAVDICSAVYNAPEAGKWMLLLAPLAAVLYTDRMVDAALTGLGQQIGSMMFNLGESMVVTVLTMVLIPRMGMVGYATVLLAGKTINLFLSLGRLIRVTGMHIPITTWIIIPLTAAVIGCVACGLGQDILRLPAFILFVGYWLLYAALTSVAGCLGRSHDNPLHIFLHGLPQKQKTAAAVRCGSHRVDTDT